MAFWAALGTQAAQGAASGIMDLGANIAAKGIGAWQDRRAWEKSWPQQQKMMRYQQQLGLEYWDKTNAEAQVQHLKNAGLNVGLMYGGSGPGGSTVQPNIPNGPPTGMGMNGVRMQTAAEINLMNAQADKAKAEADNLRGIETEKKGAEIGTEKEKQGLLKLQQVEQDIKNKIANQTTEEAVRTIKAETKRAEAEATSAAMQSGVDQATIREKIKQIKLQTTETQLRITAQKKGIQLTDEQIRKISNSINLDKQGNMREWTKLDYEEQDRLRQEIEKETGIPGIVDILKLIL